MSLQEFELDIPYYSEPPSYENFLKQHLIPNRPCIIGPSLIDKWNARKEWVVPNPEFTEEKEIPIPKFKPNYKHLRERYGSAECQVAKCNMRHFTDQEREFMTISKFVDIWEADDGKASLHYLKDTHLQQSFPKDKFYTVPNIFEDDWLNEYWLEQGDDDYKFVYWGGHQTFTPLHADVYRSYSWSSNICGIKKWTFFPPNQEELFKDKFGNIVYDIRNYDKNEFRDFESARKIVVYQKDGETVFVPSGWFHQVENIGATISINHNWSNAANLMMTYQSLKKDFDDCKESIKDLSEMMTDIEFIEECQKLLLVHSGWDWKTFLSIIDCIINHRMNSEKTLKNQPTLDWQKEQIEKVMIQWQKDDGEDLLKYLRHVNGELKLMYDSILLKISE